MRGVGEWLRNALLCVPIACAFDSGGGDGSGEPQTGSDDTDDDGESDAASADDATVSVTGGTDTTSATDPTATTDGDSTTTDASESDTDTPALVGCPDELPEAWIFCNDFDAAAASDAFSEWSSTMERMSLAASEGREGSGALQFLHVPEVNAYVGHAIVRFGDTPTDGTVYATDESFDEVYVRVFVRTESAWPDVGPGDLLGVAVEAAGDPLEEAAEVSLYSQTIEQVIGVHPLNCFTEGEPGCDGSADTLGGFYGSTPVWGMGRADAWQCIELHVQLDDRRRGGIVELRIDDVDEAMGTDFPFVDDWSDHGWNQFRLSGSWDGNGPQPELRRWIDDVVISREPIGCG